jgi:hypothetical protein
MPGTEYAWHELIVKHVLDSHCLYMALIRVDPLLDSVRHDPRYLALLARMHR